MAKRRGLILIFLSLVMAAGAAWVANTWVNGQLVSRASAQPNVHRVVAAALAIPFATKVEGRHLKYVEVPIDVMPGSAFTDFTEVQGKVSTTAIARGEILVNERFAAHERGSTLAALINENMRAITVRVDDVVGVAGFLLPGNTVDVLSSRKEANRRAVTETILKNIKVLAVDQTASADANEPVIVRAVTLEMTPKQAELVVKARTEGTIQLTLRNPEANEPAEPEPEPVQEAPRPVVAAAPRPRPVSRDTTVTVIRGTEVETTKTKN
jgi:pilus assembly protein CpaB